MTFLFGVLAGSVGLTAAVIAYFLHTWFGPGTGWPQ